MAPTVVVLDPTPVYRDGLAAGLAREGFTVTSIDEPADRAGDGRLDAALVTIGSLADLDRIRELKAGTPDLVTVALLIETTAQAYATALQAGATSAVAHAALAEDILAVLRTAVDGHTLLPTAVARELAGRWPALGDGNHLSVEEGSWLTRLANGEPVASLAVATGYSERSMHRRLHDLYLRLGVSNRAQAVALAASWGLIAQPGPLRGRSGVRRSADDHPARLATVLADDRARDRSGAQDGRA